MTLSDLTTPNHPLLVIVASAFISSDWVKPEMPNSLHSSKYESMDNQWRRSQNDVTHFGQPFIKRFALCYHIVFCLSALSVLSCLSCLSVCDVGVLWPNGWMDQDESWHASRSLPWPHCVRWGPSSTAKGAEQPLPVFGPCLLWPRSPISATAELLLILGPVLSLERAKLGASIPLCIYVRLHWPCKY